MLDQKMLREGELEKYLLMKMKRYIKHQQQRGQNIPKTPLLRKDQRAQPTCKRCYHKGHTIRKCP